MIISLTRGSRGGPAVLLETRATEVEFVNQSFIADDINLAIRIRSKGGNILRRHSDLANGFQPPVFLANAPNAVRSVIPANVNAIEGGRFVAAIHISTGD